MGTEAGSCGGAWPAGGLGLGSCIPIQLGFDNKMFAKRLWPRHAGCRCRAACSRQQTSPRHTPPPLRHQPGPLQERQDLERQWSEKLHAVEKAAWEAQAALRLQLEGRLAAVSDRVAGLAKKEAKQERGRGECVGGATNKVLLVEGVMDCMRLLRDDKGGRPAKLYRSLV